LENKIIILQMSFLLVKNSIGLHELFSSIKAENNPSNEKDIIW